MAVDPDTPSDDGLPPDPFPGDPFDSTGPAAQGGSSDPSLDDLLAAFTGGTGSMAQLGPLLGMLGGRSSGSALSWDSVRQVAVWSAAGSAVEANVDPVERIRLEETVRRVLPVVAETTGLEVGSPTIEVLTRAGWVASLLEDVRPSLERLAEAARSAPLIEPSETEPLAVLGQVFQAVGPTLVSQRIGAGFGQLGREAVATHDVLLPRAVDRVSLVASGFSDFADEWSVAADHAALQLITVDLTVRAVLRVPHVGSRLRSLVDEFAAAGRIDVRGLTDRIEQAMSGGVPDLSALSSLETTSSAQRAVEDRIAILLTPIVGFVDYASMVAGARLIGDNRKVVEAWRRRRSAESDAVKEVRSLLGVGNGSTVVERGSTFVGGVMQRAGTAGLGALWADPEHLPTPAELDAPGLWLARIGL